MAAGPQTRRKVRTDRVIQAVNLYVVNPNPGFGPGWGDVFRTWVYVA